MSWWIISAPFLPLYIYFISEQSPLSTHSLCMAIYVTCVWMDLKQPFVRTLYFTSNTPSLQTSDWKIYVFNDAIENVPYNHMYNIVNVSNVCRMAILHYIMLHMEVMEAVYDSSYQYQGWMLTLWTMKAKHHCSWLLTMKY